MITYFKNLWLDEKRFVGAIRGLVGALSVALMTDSLELAFLSDKMQTVMAFAGTFLAYFMRSNTSHTHGHEEKQ